jgi:hypothetical protein
MQDMGVMNENCLALTFIDHLATSWAAIKNFVFRPAVA